jgi:sugar phosphate isomerase/epimerase
VRTLPLTLLLAALSSPLAVADGPVHGITISTHTDGRDWASSRRMRPTMERIRELGAGWVAIHPYAGVRGDGSLYFAETDPASPPAHVVRPIRLAHELGLKILVKPHLAYWGSPFRWRGEIEFDSAASWERFWRDYERWIVGLAAAARDADGFAVGTELDRTLHHERAWRRIVARVREVSPAPLTYAANWTDYDRVPFWDALDVIGIQAYFPVAPRVSPSSEEVRSGWASRMDELGEFARREQRHIVFTELGYNRSEAAALRPWDPRTGGDRAEQLQRACLRIALQAIHDEPMVIGAFLWKWFPEPSPVGRDFQLAVPEVEEVICQAWSGRGC